MTRQTDRLAEVLASLASTAELMTVASVEVKCHQEVNGFDEPAVDPAGKQWLNPRLGDLVETVTVRFKGATRPTPPTEAASEIEDGTEAAEQPGMVRLSGDYAHVLTELLRRARPHDRVEIELTGMHAPEMAFSPATDWIAEATDLAEDMLGHKLVKVTTWMLEP